MTILQANEIVAAYKADYTPQPMVGDAFVRLGCAGRSVSYLAVVGTAGKSCVAALQASVLHAAGFAPVGCFVGGVTSLRERIMVDGKPVPARIYTAAATALAREVKEEISLYAAEFLVACHCFTKVGCCFVVMELADASYAACFGKMPVCAITQIGADAVGHGAAREARLACGVLRKGTAVVTSPTQSEETLATLQMQCQKIGCALTVPDLEDFSEKKHRRLQNRMDYGGYEVILPYLGVHNAHNAAIAIELSLALWRKGVDISDDAILEGLSLAENVGSMLPLQYRPVVVADACQTPMQAAAFARWVKEEGYEAISLLVGFANGQLVEDVFSALETATVVDFDNPQKEQLPGMSDNAFDKVYAVAPDVADALPAAEVVRLGKFHFEMIACDSLADALALAQADENEAVAVCGNAALVQAAKKLLK